MITKEELLKAWGTIRQFCDEQEHCSKCPMVLGCLSRFGEKPLETLACEFIRQI